MLAPFGLQFELWLRYTGVDTLDEPITTTIVSHNSHSLKERWSYNESLGERSLLYLRQAYPSVVPSPK